DLTGATGILNTAGVDNGNGSGEHPTTPPDPNDPNNPQTHPNPGDPSTNVPVDQSKKSLNWKSAAYTGTGAAGTVKTGDEIIYTIHIRNTGYVKLTNVVITDNIPTYTQFVSAEGGIVPDAAAKLTWTIAEVPVGGADVTRSFTVRVANDLTNATYIVNTAWVDNGDGNGNHPTGPSDDGNPNQPKPNPDPNDPATEVPVDNGKNSANWKSASYTGTGTGGAVTTGDEITYTIHVRNIGSVTLTNVLLTDKVPAYTEFVSAEGGIGPDFTGKLSWTVATIAVGAPDVTRSFKVRVVKDLTGATSIINTAAVDNGNGKGEDPTTPPDPNDPNNPHPHPNPGDPATNIPVGKVSTFDTWKTVTTASGNPKAKAGEILAYTIQVRNTGNTAIPAINITDTVPAHTTFESATNGGTYDRAANAVKWTLSNLALGTTANVSFKVKVSAGLDSTVPVITNTAFVSDGTVTVPTSGCDPASAGCNGHPGTEIETIPDESDDGLFFVNAMSPNGDGKNEYFIIKGLEKYGKAALYVFNRWGSMVYQSKEYHNDWNGTGLSEGTYFYKLELKETAGIRLYKGWVVIKRN
ncbi:MAG TPA: gliding motility-associated C-terminal domain-containing protein, partial [Chitinophaga sp.]|uniref:T9SS type B sorting domain-containing protein n=1 Tax=Chitinophaga sp. TaxID=1869181 RepID=UPI002F91D6CB